VSEGGTASYEREDDLPDLVVAAVGEAQLLGFPLSCRPEHGRLLQVLARGTDGVIGEIGTGTGVGLAWMASSGTKATLISIEIDEERAEAARAVLGSRATVLTGDGAELQQHGPFDLLVIDGGGFGGKRGEVPLDPVQWVKPGGTLTIDDFTPTDPWPPDDPGRNLWLNHPEAIASEIRLAPDLSTIVARRRS
jgi:predicted O-methyltransferase YrrM